MADCTSEAILNDTPLDLRSRAIHICRRRVTSRTNDLTAMGSNRYPDVDFPQHQRKDGYKKGPQ
jgi:hypothetical protein